jgi:fructose-bisphosphate aldolase class II
MQEMLVQAKKERYAVGAFNFVDFTTLRAVVRAAEDEKAPVILQTSAGSTVKYYGTKTLVEMVKAVAGPARVPIAFHLDHCTDVDMVLDCIEAGWTSVMYDGSSLAFDTNLAHTRKVVAKARSAGVSVEGEIGAVWGVEENIVVEEHQYLLADPDIAVQYAQESGIDALAPAIGTAHGLYKGEPKLDFDRLGRISERTETPIVIHGGTGLSDEVFGRLIDYGAAKINVSTQIKIGLFEGFHSYTAAAHKIEPIKLFKHIEAGEREIVVRFMRVFGSSGKA